jgi:hypothetical protein
VDKRAAPADELTHLFETFQEQHYQSKLIPACIEELRTVASIRLTVLKLEHQRQSNVFESLKECVSLNELFLSGNHIQTRDLALVRHLIKLRKLDLSHNQISFLPDAASFAPLSRLVFLLLHNNQLAGWRNVENLRVVGGLRYLTLQANPISKLKSYRREVIEKLGNLYCLDEVIVNDFDGFVSDLFPREAYRGRRRKDFKRFHPYVDEPWQALPSPPDLEAKTFLAHSSAAN